MDGFLLSQLRSWDMWRFGAPRSWKYQKWLLWEHDVEKGKSRSVPVVMTWSSLIWKAKGQILLESWVLWLYDIFVRAFMIIICNPHEVLWLQTTVVRDSRSPSLAEKKNFSAAFLKLAWYSHGICSTISTDAGEWASGIPDWNYMFFSLI